MGELEPGLYESLVTDELLATRARTVDEMELVSALCSFVGRASWRVERTEARVVATGGTAPKF